MFKTATTKTLTIVNLAIAMGVAVSFFMSNFVHADSIDFDIYRLGVSVSNEQVDLKFGNKPNFASGRHKVEVSTGLYMGYSLAISSDNPDMNMVGGDSMIAPTDDLDANQDLADNTWGYQVPAPEKHWLGVGSNKKVIATEDGDRPRTREYQISFGAKTSNSLTQGKYSTQIIYTVTPRIPTSPVVTAISTDRHLNNTPETLRMNGYNLDQVQTAYLDFDGDRQVDDDEICAIIESSRTATGLHCELARSMPSRVNNLHGGQFDLRFIRSNDNNQVGNDTGRQIVYYYKPTIDRIDADLIYEPHSGLNKQVDSLHGSIALGKNGFAYWWGDVPYQVDDNQLASISAPMLIQLPDETVDVAATSNSYFALTTRGAIYAWGENGRFELGNDDSAHRWSQTPTDIRPYLTGKNALQPSERFIGVDGGANHVIAVTDGGRVFTWGATGNGRLGFNTNSDASHGHGITDENRGYLDQAYRNGQRFYRVAAGDNFSAALSTAGKLYVWGGNDQGQLATNNNTAKQAIDITNLIPLAIGDKITGISASGKSLTIYTAQGAVHHYGGSAWANRARATDDMLLYPVVPAIIYGSGFDHVSNLWIDYNDDGIYQADEQITGERIMGSNKIVVWIKSAPGVSGSRTLHADTDFADYGGRDDYPIYFRQLGSSTRSLRSIRSLRDLVGDSVEDNKSDQADEKVDQPAVKPNHDDARVVDNLVTDTEKSTKVDENNTTTNVNDDGEVVNSDNKQSVVKEEPGADEQAIDSQGESVNQGVKADKEEGDGQVDSEKLPTSNDSDATKKPTDNQGVSVGNSNDTQLSSNLNQASDNVTESLRRHSAGVNVDNGN